MIKTQKDKIIIKPINKEIPIELITKVYINLEKLEIQLVAGIMAILLAIQYNFEIWVSVLIWLALILIYSFINRLFFNKKSVEDFKTKEQ